MGAINTRQNAGVEEVDINVNHAYRYPPKSGNYFSSHFIMGGERFDTAQPEMYLFGENMDLNFLGSRPAPFPYPAPSASEPIRTLKALVNIRKESLRFVRVPDESLNLKEPDNRSSSVLFNIEFTFDCDVRCAITIMYFCTEEVTNAGLVYTPRDPSMNSETYHYKRGANQQFAQVCHVFDPSQYPEEILLYNFEREICPIVIYCLAEEGEEPFQSHATIAVVEKHSDGYALKPLKQKLFVDGLCYLLQEIYGIENKNSEAAKVAADEDPDDNGAECVICMCDLRDTLILPCRHLCLCNCCADSLRYQANNCPICRAPFRALLQIKALQKTQTLPRGSVPPTNAEVKVARAPIMEGGRGWSLAQQTHVYTESNADNIPPGYEAVSLIEALNGPSVVSPPQQPSAPPFQNMYVQLPQNAVDGSSDTPLDDSDNARGYQDSFDQGKGASHSSALEDSTTQTERPCPVSDASDVAPKATGVQMRLSVLMAQDSEESLVEVPVCPSPSPPPPSASSRKKRKPKFFKEDSVTRISEMTHQKETGEVVPLSRKPRKSSSTSSVSPTTPETSPVIKETSLCTNDSYDIEGLTETLSLLDDVKVKNLDVEQPSVSSQLKPAHSISSIALVDRVVPSADARKAEPVDSMVADQHDIEASGSLPNVPSIGNEYAIDYLALRSGRGSSRKAKQRSKSSRKHRGSSSGCVTAQHVDPVDNEETLYHSAMQDSQSLPGTPLSASSAVSRSSDASMSSASSTKALIISQPPQVYSSNDN